MKYLRIIFWAFLGSLKKLILRLNGFHLSKPGVAPLLPGDREIIVTLTSYGSRVNDILPYTIHSLLVQDRKPNRIILWLDQDNWSEEKIPPVIKKYEQFGLEVRFCEDLRSYKKLIPAMTSSPDALFITADDDFYYSKSFVGKLLDAYEKSPAQLNAWRGHRPSFDETGKLLPYSKWFLEIGASSELPLFPTSGGGVIYSKELLYKDVCEKQLFQELCPSADDVWLYFMIVLQKTPVTILGGRFGISLDTFYRFRPGKASLKKKNVNQGFNDIQIANVMRHYHLSEKDLVY